jgi:Protein of unknown function (DUF3574)
MLTVAATTPRIARERTRTMPHLVHGAQRALAALMFVLSTLTPAPASAQQVSEAQVQAQSRPLIQRRIPKGTRKGVLAFARTELYFGTAKPDGVVTEEQFREFIDRAVTPRFPDGLTVLKGDGQFRGEDNVIVKEQSFVLILLYPSETFDESSKRIERIRTLYKDIFAQESVLRVDDPFIVWVSF